MKRTLTALAILTLLVTALSYGVANWCVRRSTAAEPVVDLNDTAWLKHELKLTDAQSVEIGKLEQEFSAKVEHCCETHCGARLTLSEELAKPQVDLAKANACVDRMVAAQSDSERATLDHILRVRAVLSPEQQQRYAALVSKQVCTACPIGLHHPAP
jgi:Spy/CpxP family protein refolding chaperone